MSLGDLVIRMTADMAEFRNDMGKAVTLVQGSAGQINTTLDHMGASAVSSLKRLVAGFGAIELATFAGKVISATAALDDMAEKTGASVEALSALRRQATISGQNFDSVVASMTKLAKNLAGVDDESKGAGKALAAIGLELDKVKALAADQQILAIAKSMNNFADGSGKAAVAQTLLGKSGAELLPYLKDLADAGALQASVTAEQASQAEALQKQWAALRADFDEFSAGLANGLLPLLGEIVSNLADVGRAAEGASGGFDPIKETIRALIILGSEVAFTFRAVGTEIGGIAAQMAALGRGDFKGFAAIRDMMVADAQKARAEHDAYIAKVVALGTAVEQAGAQAAAAKPKLDFTIPAESAEKYKKTVDELFVVLNRINSEDSGVSATYRKDLDTLSAGYLQGRLSIEAYAHAVALLTSQQKINVDAAKAAADAAKAIDDALEASRKDEERRLSSLEDAATAAEKEVENYGKSKAAIEAETISRLDNLRTMLKQSGATDDVIADIDREIEARRRLAGALASKDALDAAKKAQDEQKQQWDKFVDQIEQSLTDALMRGFENGKSFGQNFVDALKNTLKTTVLKVAVQAIVSPITGALRGGSGGGAFSGTMSTLSGLNGASSAYQMWSNGFSSMGMSPAVWQGINTGAYSLAGMGTTVAGGSASQAAMLAAQDSAFGSAGAAATLEAAATVEGASATAASAMSSLAAAAPYIAAFIAVASLLASEGGGPKTEGGAIRSINSAGGLSAFSTGDYYSDGRRDNLGYSANSAMSDMVGSTLTDIQALVKSLGGDGGGISIGLKFNTDPAGSAPDMVAGDVYNASGQAVFHHDSNSVGRGDYQKELAIETLRVTLAAVREANVGGVIGEFLANSISTTAGDAINRLSKEQLNVLVATLKGGYLDDILEVVGPLNTDMATLATQLLNLSPGVAALMALTTAVENMPDVFDAAREASLSTFGIYQTQTEKLLDLTQNFDGSLASAQQIADLTQARYQTEIQLIQQITDLLSSLHDSYLSAMDQVNLDTMTSAQQYEFYSNRAQQDLDVLRTLTDPALIQQYSQRFMQDVMAGWNLLDPAQKQTNRGSFENLLQTGDTVTADRLNAVQAQIRTDNQAQATALHDAVIDAITSAFTPVTTAMTNAANTPVHVDVDVNVHQQAGLETVSLGGG